MSLYFLTYNALPSGPLGYYTLPPSLHQALLQIDDLQIKGCTQNTPANVIALELPCDKLSLISTLEGVLTVKADPTL